MPCLKDFLLFFSYLVLIALFSSVSIVITPLYDGLNVTHQLTHSLARSLAHSHTPGNDVIGASIGNSTIFDADIFRNHSLLPNNPLICHLNGAQSNALVWYGMVWYRALYGTRKIPVICILISSLCISSRSQNYIFSTIA